MSAHAEALHGHHDDHPSDDHPDAVEGSDAEPGAEGDDATVGAEEGAGESAPEPAMASTEETTVG